MKYASEKFLNEIGSDALFAIANIGSLALGILPMLQSIYKNIMYDIKNCSKFTSPIDRDKCNIKSYSKAISKLKSQFDKCEKTQNPVVCKEKINSEVSKYETMIKNIEADLIEKQQAGVE